MPRAASPPIRRSAALLLATALAVACSPAPEAPSAGPGPTPPSMAAPAPEGPQGDLEAVALEVGTRLDADGRVAVAEERFRPNDTVHASLVTVGASPGVRLRVEWRDQAGAVVAADERTVAPAGPAVHTFSRAVEGGWAPGAYVVRLRLGDEDAGERAFEVR